MLRISRGPCRAPGRFVVPPSQGTPTRAMSSFFGSRSIGSRMKVAISPNRGTTMPESGSGNLSAIVSLGFRGGARGRSSANAAGASPLSLRASGRANCRGAGRTPSAHANRRAGWRLRWRAAGSLARYIRGRWGPRPGYRSRSNLHQGHLSSIERLRAPAKRCGGLAALVTEITERVPLGHHQFLERAMTHRARVPVAEKPGLPLAVDGNPIKVRHPALPIFRYSRRTPLGVRGEGDVHQGNSLRHESPHPGGLCPDGGRPHPQPPGEGPNSGRLRADGRG